MKSGALKMKMLHFMSQPTSIVTEWAMGPCQPVPLFPPDVFCTGMKSLYVEV